MRVGDEVTSLHIPSADSPSNHRLVTSSPAGMWEIFKEFFRFLGKEKKWWLMPLVLILLLLGLFLVFSASSPLAPFLYPLF